MEVAPVGVEVFEIEEQAFVMDEMRPGMPGRDMQFDDAVARHAERNNVFEGRTRVVMEFAFCCPGGPPRDHPFLAAERAWALRPPPVPRDPREAKADMRQMHDPQPRLAVVQHQLRLARRG